MSYELKDTSQRSTIDMGHEGIITEIVQDTSPVMKLRPYGKLVVLMHSRLCTISLGPDYCLFIPTFLCFAAVGYFMTKFVYSTSENPMFRFITLAVCSIQPLTYLITALSDPGAVMQSVQQPDQPAREAQTHRLIKECKKCQLWVKHDTFHCSECQVCIQEYDHHCPWVSKCIGKKNLTAFYIFLGMTPTFIIYCMVAFFICASLSLTSNIGNQH